jgi:predicted negative regulator of RcsB-dependent stress response
MSDSPERVQGDRLIWGLENFTHWVTQNVKFIAALVLIVLVAGYGAQMNRDKQVEAELSLWAEASEAKTPEEKKAFISSNSGANAAQILALELCREELDAGEPAKAESTASLFIEQNESHLYLPLAHLLRGYAREELGKNDAAKADIQEAMKDSRYAALAAQALERLN